MNAPAQRGKFRKKPRPERCVRLRWQMPGVQPVAAETKNIGFDGAFILGSAPSRAGTELTVQVERADAAPIELQAIVRWVVQAGEVHEAGFGVEFLGLDEPRREALAACFAALAHA